MTTQEGTGLGAARPGDLSEGLLHVGSQPSGYQASIFLSLKWAPKASSSEFLE